MTKFYRYINERKGDYGKEISFVDIDETIFHTFAKIHVIDKETNELIRKLDNQEFNSYTLKPNEKFDFKEFRDAKLFHDTSIPIKPMVERLKTMIERLKVNERGSKIIFLTARSDFDDKNKFLDTFHKHGIDVSFQPTVYVERTGNLKTGTVEQKKEKIIMDYLKKENYRRIRMIDDHMGNIRQFASIANKIPQNIIDSVKKEYNIPDGEVVMEFYGLVIDPDTGKLSLYDKKEIY